jgi:hypothetical protein
MLTLAQPASLLASYGGAGTLAEALQPRDVGAPSRACTDDQSPSAPFSQHSVTSDTVLLALSLRRSYENDTFSSFNMSDPIAGAAQKHPAPEGLVYTYGTAGVRGRLLE